MDVYEYADNELKAARQWGKEAQKIVTQQDLALRSANDRYRKCIAGGESFSYGHPHPMLKRTLFSHYPGQSDSLLRGLDINRRERFLKRKEEELNERERQLSLIRARLDDRAAVQQLWDDPVRDDSSLAADDQAAREERASTRRYLVTQATGIATYRHHLQRIREAGTSYLEGGTHPPSGSKEAFFKAVDQMLTQYYLIDPGTSTASKSISFHF